MMKKLLLALVLAAPLCVTGCSTAPKNDKDRQVLSDDVSATLTRFKTEDPTLQDLLNRSVGYAVFPNIGKGGLIVGGSYGKGEVFEGGKRIGWCDNSQATVGLQIGVQNFSELVVFMKKDNLTSFKSGDYSFTADVSAVAISKGAAAKTDPAKGVVVFLGKETGLMAEASVGGQRFRFHKE